MKTETMHNKIADNIIAFVSGDIFVSIIILTFHPTDAFVKFAGVFTLGVVGGFAGLVGKKMFELLICKKETEKMKPHTDEFTRRHHIYFAAKIGQ